jgi:hypothetical protein
MELSAEKIAAFEEMFRKGLTVPEEFLEYDLPYPKWQFLCYLGECKEIVFHGSQNTAIRVVEPQQAHDIKEFSNQNAIYATPDGIWVMFFAILDRKQYPMSLFNSCVRTRLSSGEWSAPAYFFSITKSARSRNPWCQGAVYLLPRAKFMEEPPQQYQEMEVTLSHWSCTEAVHPITRLRVGPEDFPFLDQIRGHDDEVLFARAQANPGGFPWIEE